MSPDNPNSVEMTGKTVDDAVQQALRRLAKSRSQVDVHVVTEGRPGVFGIGATEARVRVSVIGASGDDDPESRPLPKIDDYADYAEVERHQAGGRDRGSRGGRGGRSDPAPRDTAPRDTGSRDAAPPSRDSDQPRDRGPGGHSVPARDGGRGGSARGGSRRGGSGRARGSDDRDPIVRPEPLPFELVADPEFEPDETQDPTEFATAVLTDLVRLMRIEAAVSARAPETPMDGLNYSVAVLDVTATDGGDDLHVLIGRNGDHLAALQYMVNLIVNRALKGRHAFTVDIDGYKRRREQDLHTMATAAVAEVRETQHLVELEPMTPAERRIIHLTLSDEANIETESAGAGDARRVQIIYREA